MEISLPYGSAIQHGKTDGWQLEPLLPVETIRLKEPVKDLTKALDAPTGGKPFDQVVEGASSVAIVVPDKTRKAALHTILPTLLSRLAGLNIDASCINIIFATGIHPPQTVQQQRAIVGDNVYENYRCIDHNCDEKNGLKKIGTLAGQPLYINRIAAEAERLIIIGSIKPHYIAGFGGGRKLVLPGISSRENCTAFHKLCLSKRGVGRHEKSTYLQLCGNPMHSQAMEAAALANVDYLINVITDSEGVPSFINGGSLDESYEEATERCRATAGTAIPEKRQIVVASCGGYPTDINFIQAHKALDSACRAASDGGVVILLAECRDGIGNSSFLSWFKHSSASEMFCHLQNRFEINGQTAMSVKEKSSRCNLLLISSLADDDVRLMGVEPAKNLQVAMNMAEKLLGRKTTGWLMPNAAATLPMYCNGKGF